MSPFLVLFLVLLLGSTSYAAGRLHGQLSYRIGYRFGYRQGYFDGDRGAWSRRRREAHAAIAAALVVPAVGAGRAGGAMARQGTTYTAASFVGTEPVGSRPSRGVARQAAPAALPAAVEAARQPRATGRRALAARHG